MPPATLDDVVYALIREHLKNRGFKEAAATFKAESGVDATISSVKALCAELNITERHRARRKDGINIVRELV